MNEKTYDLLEFGIYLVVLGFGIWDFSDY